MSVVSFNHATETILQSMAWNIANAITLGASPGRDATGGSVGCLTEAMMGVTTGLVQIADAINNLAEATREARE